MEQKWLDRFTRMDELILELIRTIKDLGSLVKVVVPAPKIVDEAYRRDLEAGTRSHYETREYSLSSARTDEEIRVDGDFIHAWTDGTLDGIYVRLNHPTQSKLYFTRRNPITTPFTRFFLTHTAQSGKTLDLMIGREASASATTTEVTVSSKQSFYTVSSDKDTHFTGAIAQYAKEDENLTGLLGNKARITNIAIQADQALDFYLAFWRTDGFDDTDLDLDTFCGMVELDLATYGIQPGGANQYYMSLEGVDIDYEDEDVSNELHLSLYNASATSKNAGATGEVVVFIKYEPRA